MIEELDAQVEEWHESNSPLSLREWLGMDEEEYDQFVHLKGEFAR